MLVVGDPEVAMQLEWMHPCRGKSCCQPRLHKHAAIIGVTSGCACGELPSDVLFVIVRVEQRGKRRQDKETGQIGYSRLLFAVPRMKRRQDVGLEGSVLAASCLPSILGLVR